MVRRRGRWPCFGDTKVRYGLNGFRAKGFHEKVSENAVQVARARGIKRNFSSDDGKVSKAILTAELNVTEDNQENDVGIEETEETSASSSSSFTNLWLFQQGMKLLAKFRESSMDAWNIVYKLTKFRLLATGNFNDIDSISKIQEIYEQMIRAYPKDGVFVIYLLADDYKNRFIFMNSIAQSVLGKITPKDGGSTQKMFPKSDEYRVFRIAFISWLSGDHEDFLPFELQGLCHDGVYRTLKFKFKCYSSLKFFLVRFEPPSREEMTFVNIDSL